MGWLLSLYITTTVFGVGVTLVDLFGGFGARSEDTSDGEASAAVDEAAVGDEGTAGEESDTEGADEDGADDRVSVVAHDQRQRGNAVIRILSVARSVVYFSLGFGPVGLFATLRGESVGIGLAWSIPVGVGVMIGTRLLRKVLRQEIDSQFKGEDFIMERGKVIVSIGQGQIGKVRIDVGGVYADRYAKAKNNEEDIPAGAGVRVVDVTDEYIYVEKEGES